MERAKGLIEEIRENFRLIKVKVEALKEEEDIELNISVGTNVKTVDFNKVTELDITITAIIHQEL
jgi:hypothetical protein